MTIIGIDLGTSNSAAAVLRGGRPVIIPSAEGITLGGKAFPSYVAVARDGEIIVGEPARRQQAINPEGTVSGFKRLMGQRDKIRLAGKEFTPEELSALLLQKIKRDAEAFLGGPVDKAVITVPAYFNDNQRSATKDACRIAGLEAARLVNEPTAASLAYGLDRLSQELRIAVIDFGGGTLDVTIMEFGKGVFEVKATSGNTQLGGTDMDRILVEHLASTFQSKSGIDIRNDRGALARLREAAEIAKIELSNTATARINLPFLSATAAAPAHLDYEFTRTELERLVRPVIERCREPVVQAFHDASLQFSQIDRLIFVGGPTRMPCVRAFFQELIGKKAESGVDPMECVAQGAAIQAGVLAGEVGNIVLVDVTPLTLGIETLGNVATSLIPATRQSRSSVPKSLRRRRICRRALRCMSFKANGRWFRTISASANSTSTDCLPPRAGCRGSRSASISMPMAFSTRPRKIQRAAGRNRSASPAPRVYPKQKSGAWSSKPSGMPRTTASAEKRRNSSTTPTPSATRPSARWPTTATKSPKSCEGGSKRPCAIRGRLLPPRTLRRRRARLTLSKPCSRRSDKAFTRAPSRARGRALSNPPVRRLRPAALEWSMPNTSRRRPSFSL